MEVRGWVRAEEDPEPTLHTIKKTVMPEGRYDNAGQWFLGSAQFLDWCGTFHASQSEDIQPKTSDQLPATDTASVDAQGPTPDPSHDIVTTGSHEPPALFTPNEECPVSGSSELNTADDVKEEDPVAKRVLWLRGGYKKGKTTIMYHTYVSMDTSADFRLVDKELRVIPYFCDASSTDQTNQKRPKHETILRGLLWHMSLLPDFGLAEPVQDKYNAYHSTRAPKQKPEVEDWETLFTNLVSDDRYHYTFMVDALDECLSPEQSAKFLEFMSKVLKAHPNTSLLCSSHAQVNIQVFFGQDNDYFGADTLEVVDVTAEKSMDDMNYFIQSELERRRVQAKRSIFYNPQHQDLLANLEDALKSDAQGNFRWVQIWLDILLPKDDYNDMLTIKDEEVAKQRLRQLQVNMTYKHDEYQQLEAGYQRLWDLNRLIDAEELKLRDRLFHIVLASEWAQTPETLSKVLRFRERSYSNYPQPIDVERMSSNFLVYVESSSGNEGFRFVDEAAKRFVLSMDSPESNNATKPKTKVFARQNNHKAVAEVYTQLIGSATHPYWQHAGLLPFNWTKLLSGNEDSERLKLDIQHWRTKRYGPLPDFHFYLAKFGFRHCAEAAEEHSLYDPVWTEVIKKVILNPRSAFGFVALAEEQVEPAQMFRVYTAPLATWMMWGQQDGRLQLLHSHAIALLDIASPDDSIRLQTALQDLKGKPDEILNSYEYRLFKDSACVGGAIAAPPGYVSTIKHKEATALQIACVQHNRATVEMILEVSSTLTHIPADHILYIDTATFPFPLCISIAPRDEFDTGAVLNNTARPLLLYEKRLDILRRDSVDSNKAHETPAIAPFKSKQWSLLHHTDKDPALILGALFHRGDMLLHMLRIAPPEDINVRGIDDYTALHFAAGQGNDVVVRGLVEEFGADVNLENSEGHTPGMLARRNGFTRVVQYLKERGADVGDSEDEDAPNRDTLIDAIFAQVGEF
ncbi:hypothetical protein DE146DRAFT_660167 [Phaeosphaeria sp. MPI-PUGE-AT-0046c]|nr:hypothetical protein DE146DRAFT_660167 [Phaeosphaeria sp. MPI-PUGE-AT-0046c]